MQIRNNRKAGFTLVEIMIVVAIIGLLAAIAIPNFVKAREQARTNACIANMRQLEGAVEQWALEKKKGPGETPAIDDLVSTNPDSYIKKVTTDFVCPATGVAYATVAVGDRPVCPSVGTMTTHVLD
jgi:prepilin-type N-terminal cleavage/methylation domain-containing protein